MSNRDACVAKTKAAIAGWNAGISAAEARARSAEADARIDDQKRVAALQARREEAETNFCCVRSDSDTARQDVKSGVGNAWSEMPHATKAAAPRFGS